MLSPLAFFVQRGEEDIGESLKKKQGTSGNQD
jgi:hypothetical protein